MENARTGLTGHASAWLTVLLSAGLGLAVPVAAGGQARGILLVTALVALLGMAASTAASITLLSAVQRRRRSGVERAPGNADA